jgi:proteasome lid subunit RPN8/RPN11
MIGYLVGRPFRDARGPYAVVTEALLAESARCGPVTVETSLDDERELLATLLADHPLAERLGWFHSHPFYLPSYSPTDLENQRFWSERYQLGLLACLDLAGGVSIFAFRGPEAEAIHPSYRASWRSPSNRVPTFRPIQETDNQHLTPETAQPTNQKRHRRSGLRLLTLAVGVVWPMIYLFGVGMIVQALRDVRDSAAGTVAVSKDGTAPADQRSHRAPVEATRPGASPVVTPARSVGQPTGNTSATGHR